MTIEERKKRFEEAKRVREQNKKEHEGGFSFGKMEDYECVALEPNKCHVIRLIGEIPESNNKTEYDSVMVKRSLVVGDDGKYFTLIWNNDPNHVWNRFVKTLVGKYTYDKETKHRDYENKDLESFKRFMTNGKENPSPYERGMQADTFYLFNCIDRSDDWCEKNKHTKLLCWDKTESEKDGKTNTFYSYGIKKSLWNEIFDVKCTQMASYPSDIDFVIRRYTKKTAPSESKYVDVYSPEEKSAIRQWGEKDGVDYYSMIHDEFLTEEEESYTRYKLADVDWVSKSTPISVILNRLPNLIKLVDKEHGTNFYEEFVEEKGKELEILKAKQKEEEESSEKTSTTEEKPNFNTMKKVEVESEVDDEEESEIIEEDEDLPTEVEEPKPTKKVMKTMAFNPMSLTSLFPSITNMSEDDRKLIIGYDEENDEFKYSTNDLAQCPSCGRDIPDSWTKCTCGVEFE